MQTVAKPQDANIQFGALAPGWFDHAVITLTSSLPDNWLGLRLAIGLRRLATMRLAAGALDVERWGLRMRLHPRDNGCEKRVLFTPQMFDSLERRELSKDIAKAKAGGRRFVFIDIGANVGLFSLFVAADAGRNAQILAIEPEPGNFARLQFNRDANPGLRIHPLALALGEEEGEAVIVPHAFDRGGTRTRKPGPEDRDAVRVRCRPLLPVLTEQGIASVDAVKIDVEGAEDKVLVPFFRDAPAALWPGLILIEDTSNIWSADLFSLLAARGYRIDARSRQNVVLRRVAS
ncbi:MAG TPA: FkbM family methyltransferase [Xanthobacteraceae bacterium]|nr:FkbM family methyltransferase [Xanthobacteraceae bacterium]